MADIGEQFSLGCTESGWSQLGNHLKMQFAEPAIIPKEECQANPSAVEMAIRQSAPGQKEVGQQ